MHGLRLLSSIQTIKCMVCTKFGKTRIIKSHVGKNNILAMNWELQMYAPMLQKADYIHLYMYVSINKSKLCKCTTYYLELF